MKIRNYLLVVFYLLVSSTIFSQDYIKTVYEGREWTIAVNKGMGNFSLYYYHISCDTIIGNELYYKVNSEYYEEARGYVREDTIEQKVYFWSKDSISERLVLDYQLEAGDTFDFGGGDVWEVDSITYSNSGRKRIYFPILSQIVFEEGYGRNWNGIIHHIIDWQSAGVNDTLIDCNLTSTAENVLLEPAIEIYPNPTRDQLNITSKEIEGSISYSIVDINGKIRDKGIVQGSRQIDVYHLENGIYFLKLITGNNKVQLKKIMISN